MSKQFEIVLPELGVATTAALLEDAAPITCQNFWYGIREPWRHELHHGRETGPELWCFVDPPQEELPYENATVFPEGGDILYYHYIQPPTRDGIYIYDIGIYYGRGCSKLKQGWISGNHFARVVEQDAIQRLERVAAYLLTVRSTPVILHRLDAG